MCGVCVYCVCVACACVWCVVWVNVTKSYTSDNPSISANFHHVQVESLEETERGSGGFGSSGLGAVQQKREASAAASELNKRPNNGHPGPDMI